MSRFDAPRDPSPLGQRAEGASLLEECDTLPLDRDIGDAPLRPRRRLGGVLLFGAVMVAAFGSLWSMRAISRANATTGSPTEAGRLVESYLNERTKAEGKPTTAELATAPLPIGGAEELQVPRERLARDPFAAPWRTTGRATVEQTAPAAPAADAALSPVAAWEALVDQGARDFVVESILLAPNPAMSIVSMNGGVFRVGESVMFADQSVRYEIRAVDAGSVTLVAFNAELGHERVVRLLVREQH